MTAHPSSPFSFSPNMVRKTVKLIGPGASFSISSISSCLTFKRPGDRWKIKRVRSKAFLWLFWSLINLLNMFFQIINYYSTVPTQWDLLEQFCGFTFVKCEPVDPFPQKERKKKRKLYEHHKHAVISPKAAKVSLRSFLSMKPSLFWSMMVKACRESTVTF